MAILGSKERNLLPDSDYAAVYTVVKRKNGRMSHTKVRKLPLTSASHVRNALARFGQTQLPSHVKTAAHEKIVAAAKKHKIAID